MEKISQAVNFSDLYNKINIKGGKFPFSTSLTIGEIVFVLVRYFYVVSGLVLLLYLIIAGYQLMVSGGDPKAIQGAKNKIVYGLVGFLIIFSAYWITKIVALILGNDAFSGVFD